LISPGGCLRPPLLCAPARRPTHLLGCSASPRLAACLASCLRRGATRLPVPVYPSCLHLRCRCAYSGHPPLGAPTSSRTRRWCGWVSREAEASVSDWIRINWYTWLEPLALILWLCQWLPCAHFVRGELALHSEVLTSALVLHSCRQDTTKNTA
jgi:hypothetical protein